MQLLALIVPLRSKTPKIRVYAMAIAFGIITLIITVANAFIMDNGISVKINNIIRVVVIKDKFTRHMFFLNLLINCE